MVPFGKTRTHNYPAPPRIKPGRADCGIRSGSRPGMIKVLFLSALDLLWRALNSSLIKLKIRFSLKPRIALAEQATVERAPPRRVDLRLISRRTQMTIPTCSIPLLSFKNYKIPESHRQLMCRILCILPKLTYYAGFHWLGHRAGICKVLA